MAQFRSFSSVPKFSDTATLNPANIPAGQTSVETFTVTGLKTNNITLVEAPSLETGVSLISARCSANDTLELVFWNYSGGAVNPASQDFLVVQI